LQNGIFGGRIPGGGQFRSKNFLNEEMGGVCTPKLGGDGTKLLQKKKEKVQKARFLKPRVQKIKSKQPSFLKFRKRARFGFGKERGGRPL